MKSLILLIFTIRVGAYAEEFSSRPRNFSMELLHNTYQHEKGHIVISPFGVWSLMTGIALGAQGESKSQIVKTLRLPPNEESMLSGYRDVTNVVLDSSTESVSLTSKYFAFIDHTLPIKTIFKQKLKSNFGTEMIYLNFSEPVSAAEKANEYILGSGASVSNVLRSNDFQFSLMLFTNVIAFKGLWTSQFNKSETMVEAFYDENNNKIGDVNMMSQTAKIPHSYMESLESEVIKIPYGKDQKYFMLVILPSPEVKATDVYERLHAGSFQEIFDTLQSNVNKFGPSDVNIKLPRFRISTNILLNTPLNKMGIKDIFDENAANFEHITDKRIFVSLVVHKAEIEVSESGTVASAVSEAHFQDRKTKPNFEANRPFIYFVMEKSAKAIIFGGIYSQPSIF